MAVKLGILKNLTKLRMISTCRSFNSAQVVFNKPGPSAAQSAPKSSPTSTVSGNVPGLSSAVVQFGKEPVGPGASKDSNYKNPEYFCYNQTSYFEAEIEMSKYRCPQPSSKK